MKYFSKIALNIVLAHVILISCTSNQNENSNDLQIQIEENAVEINNEIEAIKALDDKLIRATYQETIPLAKELYQKAQDFANKYPDHIKTPPVLEVAAKAAEAMGKFDEAVTILHKLIYDFPETSETPKYMWNKARVIEEKLNKIPNAKAAYTELINRFPNHQMAIDAQFYIDNYLGKSDAEIKAFLDQMNP